MLETKADNKVELEEPRSFNHGMVFGGSTLTNQFILGSTCSYLPFRGHSNSAFMNDLLYQVSNYKETGTYPDNDIKKHDFNNIAKASFFIIMAITLFALFYWGWP